MNYNLVLFCEFDKYAAESYCAIHGVSHDKNIGDITKANEHNVPDFNVMFGGSPCQDFSIAGKTEGAMWTCMSCRHKYNPLEAHYTTRDKCPCCGSNEIEKTRSSLIVEWLRFLREKKPKFAIYENVKNLVGKKFKPTFDLFLKELEEYGYNVYWQVLNAKDYGIPQNRERVYCIIVRKDLDNGKFKFPKPFDNGVRLNDMLEDVVDEKYYINTQAAKDLIKELVTSGRLNKAISNTIRTGGRGVTSRRQTQLGYCFSEKCSKVTHGTDIAMTITARDYKGFGNQSMTGVIEVE